jgi:ribosomal protein S14
MKKLLEKDKKLRINLKQQEKQHFIFKSIYKNTNFFLLIRWNAFLKLKSFATEHSIVSTSYRCINSFNRKRYHKLAPFSRHIFLKLIRAGKITGLKKASW